MLHGGYVGFKNKASGKYLTVPNGTTSTVTNVCQQSTTYNMVHAQEFHLQYSYNPGSDWAYFTIFPLASSGTVVTNMRIKAETMTNGLANVLVQSTSMSSGNERWQIEHVTGTYYCIYLADNPDSASVKYALTSNNGGNSPHPVIGSSDNVYVSAYAGDDSQLWQICADGRPMDINGYDITQGGSQEAVLGTTVSYYYVPKAFNSILLWSVSPSDMASSYGGGHFVPKKYGEMTVKLQCSSNGMIPIVKSSALFSIPQEGKYYIENVGTGRYIDIEGPSKLADRIIQQWDFHSGNYEKWRVVYDDETTGYIRFKSAYSGKYIAVDDVNTSVIKQVSVLDDYSLWKVVTSTHGNIQLICKAIESSNKVMSVPTTANNNGTDLTTGVYTNNTNYYDEWSLQEIKYTYTLSHYYDLGYISRFYDAGDDIELYHDIVAHLLFQCFKVEVLCDIQTYTSCADECTGVPVEILDPISFCHHNLNDENQPNHKTRGSIKADIVNQFGSGSKYRTRIAWSGHNLGTTRATSFATDFVVIIPVSSNVAITGNEITNELIKYDRVFSLLHEVSHQLGAVDHYCYGDQDEQDDKTCSNPNNSCWKCDLRATAAPICMMSEYNKNSLAEVLSGGDIQSLYCSSCFSDTDVNGILTHLNDHH